MPITWMLVSRAFSRLLIASATSPGAGRDIIPTLSEVSLSVLPKLPTTILCSRLILTRLVNLVVEDTSTIMTENSTAQVDISELVHQAKQGDDEAFGMLVERYQDKIYGYVSRMLHDPEEAEDVAQEVFIRAYQNLAGFREAASFPTWLYRIATNLAIDAARSRKSRRANSFSLDEPVETDAGEISRQLSADRRGTVSQVESSHLQQIVTEAIAQLSAKLRTVITLYDIEGLSYEEIAEVLGCPVGTVKSRLFNARNQLRDKLEEKIDVENWLAELP